MLERFKLLLQEMNRGIYEKNTEISLSLLAALAGESVILLGPPGVAKSMVARQLKTAFWDARSFEYLMSRFSTPDEIFGPVSIQKLKTSDTYERAVEGYLHAKSPGGRNSGAFLFRCGKVAYSLGWLPPIYLRPAGSSHW